MIDEKVLKYLSPIGRMECDCLIFSTDDGVFIDYCATHRTAPALLEACEAINEWCGTDAGAQAIPFEPPWYQQLHAALAAARPEEATR